jgi:hypothetical protein
MIANISFQSFHVDFCRQTISLINQKPEALARASMPYKFIAKTFHEIY